MKCFFQTHSSSGIIFCYSMCSIDYTVILNVMCCGAFTKVMIMYCMLHSSGHVSIVIAIKCFLCVSLLLSPQYGDTPLHEASSNGHSDVVRLLLENKADPNISNEVSYSIIPIH